MRKKRTLAELDPAVTQDILLSEDAALRLPAVTPPVIYPLETLVPQVRLQTPAVGQRATRPDGRLHGLGQTRYIDDLAFPGMLFAKIKRAGIAADPFAFN